MLRSLLIAMVLLASACRVADPGRVEPVGSTYGPGKRVLLDAHNAYPERGKFADRIDLALATGLPVAIEQDLYWARNAPVVAHDDDALAGAPTFDSYFIEKIRPIMERALAEPRRDNWPLIVLNLDFKTNEAELHEAVLTILRRNPSWLTSVERTSTPDRAEPMVVGPLLVLCGQDARQRASFHDRVPIGGRVQVFGAIPVRAAVGATREEMLESQVRTPAASMIASDATNYARWVNFPWQVVELGGAARAGEWTSRDSTRLQALVGRAHENGLWIRFYTLDGYDPARNEGLTASYNFGSDDAVRTRWRAAIAAGVDFIATDHYARFNAERRSAQR